MIIKRGRLQQAEAAYRQVLAVEPAHAEALHLLGAIAHRAGRNDLAIHYIRQAVGLDDARPNYYNSLAVVLRDLGRNSEAEASLTIIPRLKITEPRKTVLTQPRP